MIKNIAIYGGGWEQNIGNAFIQIGSKYAIKQAFPEVNVHIVDGNPFPIPSSPIQKLGKKLHLLSGKFRWEKAHANEVKIFDFANIDAIVLSGVWLTARYLKEHMQDFINLKKQGVSIIMNGVGGTHYSKQEFSDVQILLEKIEPSIIITRDDNIFNSYKNIKNIHAGIDVGFFVNNAFPNPLPTDKTTAYCFDRASAPSSLDIKENDIVTHHAQKGFLYENFEKGKIFFSEFAEDYLNLYANADTYSDRVHACVATLAFGNSAKLIDTTPRAKLFDRVGATNIQKQCIKLDMNLLNTRKEEHIGILKSAIF